MQQPTAPFRSRRSKIVWARKLHNALDRLNPHGRPEIPLYTLSLTAQISKAELGLKFQRSQPAPNSQFLPIIS